MQIHNENTTDATRGMNLRERVAARKTELEGELAKLAPGDRSIGEIELALNEVSGLLTGDLDHIPHVVAAELNHWLEVSKHVAERHAMPAPGAPAREVRELGSYTELVAFLMATKVPHTTDPAHLAVQIMPVPPALPNAVYLRWDPRLPYIQLIQQITGPVSDERIRDVEAAISRINDAAAIPGFGFSYEKKVIYYRLAVPIYSGTISSDALLRSIEALVHNAAQLAPALVKVVAGGPGADVLH